MLDVLKERLLVRLAMTKNSHAFVEEQIIEKNAKIAELEYIIKMIDDLKNNN